MLLKKRILAALIDYLVIALYGCILFNITIVIFPLEELSNNTNPINGQLIGFVRLTLPVFLYFYFMEWCHLKASLGKLALKIEVNSESGSLLKRNVLKFLPWEIAHIGIHWMFYYNSINMNEPFWVWVILILPQLIAIIYFVSIIYSKGTTSLYDRKAYTLIRKKT